MISRRLNQEQTLVHSLKLSSVGPGRVTGQDTTHDPTNIDLAMKLHYLRFIYYFTSETVLGMSIYDYKQPMFDWLNLYYVTCGRFRRAGSGRPYIKCNDCGVRIIEALCEKTLDEWLMVKDSSMEKMLVYEHVIGPEMQFSPVVLIQLTTFKCGGLSLGLNWAHVLGDPFAASGYMSVLGKIMAGQIFAPFDPRSRIQAKRVLLQTPPKDPLSLKQVESVGDHWKITNICEMKKISFNLSSKKISHLLEKVNENFGYKIPIFESLCAIVWRSVAKIRSGSEPKVVTICKNSTKRDESDILGNGQAISVVEAEFPVTEASFDEIGKWICYRTVEDLTSIEGAVERNQGLSDFIFYGANLTFLDLEGADIYGFKIKGNKPVYVSCSIDGVGEEGVVLVIPDGKGGKVVTLIMPEKESLDLKSDLEREFEIA